MIATTYEDHPSSSLMHHKQRMTYDELLEEAQEAVRHSGKKQNEIAEELNVTPGAVSRALNQAGAKVANLQTQIIELYTDYRIIQTVEFQAFRKDLA